MVVCFPLLQSWSQRPGRQAVQCDGSQPRQCRFLFPRKQCHADLQDVADANDPLLKVSFRAKRGKWKFVLDNFFSFSVSFPVSVSFCFEIGSRRQKWKLPIRTKVKTDKNLRLRNFRRTPLLQLSRVSNSLPFLRLQKPLHVGELVVNFQHSGRESRILENITRLGGP